MFAISMTHRYSLVHDTLLANGLHGDADFLQSKVAKVHVDCLTYDLEHPQRDGDGTVDANHWVIVIETEHAAQFRLDVVDMTNPRTGRPGVVMLHRLGYKGKTSRTAGRVPFSWRGPALTVGRLLEHALAEGWHRYEMVRTEEGAAAKGCRYYVSTILGNLQQADWIGKVSDKSCMDVEEDMSWRYTKLDESCNPGYAMTPAGPLDRGTFY